MDLSQLAEQLKAMVGRFKLNEERGPLMPAAKPVRTMSSIAAVSSVLADAT
jgi:hypothetical protein